LVCLELAEEEAVLKDLTLLLAEETAAAVAAE
jgi:hypothetical protein